LYKKHEKHLSDPADSNIFENSRNDKNIIIDSINANKIYNKLKKISDTKKITKIVPRQRIKSIDKIEKIITTEKTKTQILTTVDKMFPENYNTNKNKIIDYNEFMSEIKLVSISGTDYDSEYLNNNSPIKQFNSFNKYTSDIHNLHYAENTYNKLRPLIEGTNVYINDRSYNIDFSATRLPDGLEQYFIKYKECSIVLSKLDKSRLIPVNTLAKTLITKQFKENLNNSYRYYPMALELQDKSKIELIFTNYSDFKSWLNGIAYLLRIS
jgi:hypothetical protein